jgi:hypothetical protein
MLYFQPHPVQFHDFYIAQIPVTMPDQDNLSSIFCKCLINLNYFILHNNQD